MLDEEANDDGIVQIVNQKMINMPSTISVLCDSMDLVAVASGGTF